jgi:hypothetical protein
MGASMGDSMCLGTIGGVNQMTPKITRATIKKVANGFVVDPEFGEDRVFLTLHEAVLDIERLLYC